MDQLATLASLEKKLSYQFKEPEKLKEVITHPSLRQPGEVSAYQRYEFLGDRVVGLTVAKLLFDAYPAQEEGFLAKAHSHFVCRETLAEIGMQLGLEKYR